MKPCIHLFIVLPNPCWDCRATLIDPDKTGFLTMFSVCLKNIQRKCGRATHSCSPFLYEIIHPPAGSQLADTQVPVICSQTTLTLWYALYSPSCSVHHEHSAGASIWSRSMWDDGEICQLAQCFTTEPSTDSTCPAVMDPARSGPPGRNLAQYKSLLSIRTLHMVKERMISCNRVIIQRATSLWRQRHQEVWQLCS